jgi:ubiquinone/menaquinone biosynthesis C-methylase UbiE
MAGKAANSISVDKTHSLPSLWSSHAASGSYSPVERITLPLCSDLVRLSDQTKPFGDTSTRVFDNGAGTGILTAQVQAHFPDTKVVAADISQGMIDCLNRLSRSKQWRNVETVVADAQALSFEESSFTHSMSTFMIGSAEHPDRVIAEMYRVTVPGGMLGLGAWAGGCWGPIWQKAVRMAECNEMYTSPQLIHKNWNNEANITRGVKAVGWRVCHCKTSRSYWGWQSADEVDQYIFEAGNPIVGLLMTDMAPHQIQKIRQCFRRVVEEDYHHGKDLYETAVLLTAMK